MGTGERIVIRCDRESKHSFQEFAVPYEDQEAALLELLDRAERLDELEARLAERGDDERGVTPATR